MSDQPAPQESQFNIFGNSISLRGLLAFILVSSLCGVTFHSPEAYADTFKITVTAVVAFYFGQSKK